jgi:hypothetical protein
LSALGRKYKFPESSLKGNPEYEKWGTLSTFVEVGCRARG